MIILIEKTINPSDDLIKVIEKILIDSKRETMSIEEIIANCDDKNFVPELSYYKTSYGNFRVFKRFLRNGTD